MFITDFKRNFYSSIREAIEDNCKGFIVSGSVPKIGNVYLINNTWFKLIDCSYFNEYFYYIKLRKCTKKQDKEVVAYLW